MRKNFITVVLSFIAFALLTTSCGSRTLSFVERNPNGIQFAHRLCPDCDDCQKIKHGKEDREIYILTADNVPKQKTFYLFMRRSIDDLLIGEYRLNNGKLYLVNNPYQELSDCRIILDKETFGQGEPIELYLMTLDGKNCVKTCIIPRPVTIIGKDGAKINVLLKDSNIPLFLLEGSGFKSSEKMTVLPLKYNTALPLNVDSEGKFSLFLVGRDALMFEMDVFREMETLHVEFLWDERKSKQIAKHLEGASS